MGEMGQKLHFLKRKVFDDNTMQNWKSNLTLPYIYERPRRSVDEQRQPLQRQMFTIDIVRQTKT